jgi:hypothetical protein
MHACSKRLQYEEVNMKSVQLWGIDLDMLQLMKTIFLIIGFKELSAKHLFELMFRNYTHVTQISENNDGCWTKYSGPQNT